LQILKKFSAFSLTLQVSLNLFHQSSIKLVNST
jgi:hypothetical protein